MLTLSGMRSNVCRERIIEALGRVKGVKGVNVSLIRAHAVVVHDTGCDPAELMEAVTSVGYSAALEEDSKLLMGGRARPNRPDRAMNQGDCPMSLVKTELKAKDVMTPDPVCVAPSTRIRELARVFEEHEISGAPVVDQEGKVVGVVSKTDLIRRCSEGTDEVPPAYLFEILSEQGEQDDTSEVMPEPLVCVEDFMTEDPLMVGPGVSAASVARLMFEKRIHRVIVADDEKFPIGIVTSMDLLGAFSR